MSKQVTTSNKFSSLEVVESAKFDNEIVFEDLTMEGTALTITASEDIVISSTGEETPWGVSILAAGPVTSSSTESSNFVLSGFDGGAVQNDGSVVLGHSTATVPVSVVEAAYDATAEESRLGFFGATAVAQAAAVTPATAAAAAYDQTEIQTIVAAVNDVITALTEYGLLAA